MPGTSSAGVTSSTSVSSTAGDASTATGDINYLKFFAELDIYTIAYPRSTGDFSRLFAAVPKGESLVKVIHMSRAEFTEWADAHEDAMYRIFFYSADIQILILKKGLSAQHELLHLQLVQEISQNTTTMGLQDEFCAFGTTDFEAVDREEHGQPDSSFGPDNLEEDNHGFPTLVIEASWSQTRNQLRAKMRWWFAASNGAVRIVILVIASRNRRDITIEKWKLGPVGTRPGAVTRHLSVLLSTPTLCRTITISRPGANFPPASYRLTGTPLRLEFQDLYLRQPVPPQSDILFDDAWFRGYARRVCNRIDLADRQD